MRTKFQLLTSREMAMEQGSHRGIVLFPLPVGYPVMTRVQRKAAVREALASAQRTIEMQIDAEPVQKSA